MSDLEGEIMFTITFYIFSLFLSFTDYKYYLVPNIMTKSMLALMVIFGLLEGTLHINSIIVAFIVIVFFVVLILIDKKMTLGGGDIKYIALVALYLSPLEFAYFLILSGILQTLHLTYTKVVLKKNEGYMVPAIFLAAMLTDVAFKNGLLPF